MAARTITDVQADLDAAYAARRAAFQAQSYSFDSGQGRQTVARVDMRALSREISILEQELSDWNADAEGATALDRIAFDRGGAG
jgi:hypothetical protein